ncbi:uncharacterized protein [Aegilops tauschii subsp. strangulata]|uniref:uncharacterized protein n=1 Tax=Aegilops tauschii subsp. strangulata TaxID=200361 RepID=UPI003CC8B099
MLAWLLDVQKGYQDDSRAQQLLARLAASSTNTDGFQLQNGVIKQHGRVWLGDNVNLQKQHPFTAFQVEQAFVANIYKLHGLPESIISDCDLVFTSTLCHLRFPDLSEWVADRAQMEALVRQHLLRARQQMKDLADKCRSDRIFAVGDRVFLKLQLYVQRSEATHSNQKLAFCYFGPYKVLQRIGAVAYKLQLPPTSTIHPVFHVS